MTFKKVKKDPTKGYRYVKKGGQGGKRAGAGLKPKFGSKLKNISVGVPEHLAETAVEIAKLRKFFKSCLTAYEATKGLDYIPLPEFMYRLDNGLIVNTFEEDVDLTEMWNDWLNKYTIGAKNFK